MFGDDRELHAYLQRLVGSMLSAEVSDQSVLAGGDVIRTRRMRQDNVEFAATLLLATNHRPNITGRDDGIWRRIRALPMTATFDTTRRDPTLEATLRSELPGILAGAVEGAVGWYADRKLAPPQIITDATAAYRQETDPIGGFITERCRLDEQAITTSADLYAADCNWAHLAGERALSQKQLSPLLASHGLIHLKVHGPARRAAWCGVTLTSAR